MTIQYLIGLVITSLLASIFIARSEVTLTEGFLMGIGAGIIYFLLVLIFLPDWI